MAVSFAHCALVSTNDVVDLCKLNSEVQLQLLVPPCSALRNRGAHHAPARRSAAECVANASASSTPTNDHRFQYYGRTILSAKKSEELKKVQNMQKASAISDLIQNNASHKLKLTFILLRALSSL
jgi:hypothetical protein